MQKMKKTYILDKQEPIAIYGGGPIGLEVARKLIRAGYNVVCILDSNPPSVENPPVPVFTPKEGYKNIGEAFVYVTIGNGATHMTVAKILLDIGYHKLLFLPLYLRSSAAKDMVKKWTSFLIGIYDVSLAFYDDLWNVSSEDYVLEHNYSLVTVVIHKNHVYTSRGAGREDNPLTLYTNVIKSMQDKYKRFLSTGKDCVDSPIDNLVTSTSVRKSILEFVPFREGVMPMLETALFSPAEFFTEMAIPAEFNENGYFNILDGTHRTMFLLDKGFTGIPLKVKKTEWELYFREPQAQALMDYCKNLDSLPLEVKHPAFVRLPVQEREPDEEFLRLYNDLQRLPYVL